MADKWDLVHTSDYVAVTRCRDCARAELRGVQIEGEPDTAILFCIEWLEKMGPDEYCSRGKEKNGPERRTDL